ncbi:hypothetical protein CN899_21085 [Bacillus thuringiensis]|uniref:Uncharacterized protein n=1 Tax=Bacillus thuringiensis TaxID=1428 RepID=A0A9X7GHL0_BACTU|nr:hypothetical protein [Bacillus thuringiensis]PGH81040.1 hypothetical protein CN899_21085 [Bacillus thuringiensis]
MTDFSVDNFVKIEHYLLLGIIKIISIVFFVVFSMHILTFIEDLCNTMMIQDKTYENKATILNQIIRVASEVFGSGFFVLFAYALVTLSIVLGSIFLAEFLVDNFVEFENHFIIVFIRRTFFCFFIITTYYILDFIIQSSNKVCKKNRYASKRIAVVASKIFGQLIFIYKWFFGPLIAVILLMILFLE